MTLASGSAAAFDWAWHPHPDVWVAVAGLAVAYTVALRRFAPPAAPAVAARQRLSFYAGLLLLLGAADWPLHDISEGSLFSAHMFQHLILTFVAPPLLMLGVPRWLYRRVLRPGPLARIWGTITRPVIAFAIFNGLMLATHWPVIVDLSIRSVPAHLVLHWVLIGSAVVMWWPVIAPLPELSRLSEPAKMFYLFLQSILPTVPASFLTFADSPIYSGYEGLPHLWGLSTVGDQQIAGLIMKLGGGLLLWAVITYLFFRWNAREESGRVDEVDWEDFERGLQMWDLRR